MWIKAIPLFLLGFVLGHNETVHPDRGDSIKTPDMDGNIYEGGIDDNRY